CASSNTTAPMVLSYVSKPSPALIVGGATAVPLAVLPPPPPDVGVVAGAADPHSVQAADEDGGAARQGGHVLEAARDLRAEIGAAADEFDAVAQNGGAHREAVDVLLAAAADDGAAGGAAEIDLLQAAGKDGGAT